MNEKANDDQQNAEKNEVTAAAESQAPSRCNAAEPGPVVRNLRAVSIFVLFIAAVFVTNAMETGSYRTPWPVAIVTALAGFGLYGYSWYRQIRPGK